MENFGDRQQNLLKLLLKKKPGMSIEEISAGLGITRPATRQHLSSLERRGYVERGDLLASGGRPGQSYRLSKNGYDLFPKQYSWFSEVLVESLKSNMGSSGVNELMSRMGQEIGAQVEHRVDGKTLPEKVRQIAELMNDLAYQAEVTFTGKELPGSPPVIEASNCVYHSIAEKFPEVCQFDIALLTRLTGAQVVHEQCIVRGGGTCRFRFKQKPAAKN